jgi:uncharacterized protein GlcG (DUF336 family)
MLTLEQASIIVDKALEKGRELGLKPLTVTVLDAGGHLTALKREDGSQSAEAGNSGRQGLGRIGRGPWMLIATPGSILRAAVKKMSPASALTSGLRGFSRTREPDVLPLQA